MVNSPHSAPAESTDLQHLEPVPIRVLVTKKINFAAEINRFSIELQQGQNPQSSQSQGGHLTTRPLVLNDLNESKSSPALLHVDVDGVGVASPDMPPAWFFIILKLYLTYFNQTLQKNAIM